MSGYIEPFPLRDATIIYSIWRRGQCDYEVTLSYTVAGQSAPGHDSRVFPFRSVEAARLAIPPWLTLLPPDPEDDPPSLVESWI
jgi:hypothetical protein